MNKKQRIFNHLNQGPHAIYGLIAECRDHLDREIALRVYRERGYAHFTEMFNGGSSLREFLERNIRQTSDRQEFLAYYLEELREKVAGKANCGCVHHAESGVPCHHDMALLNRPSAPPPPKPANDPGMLVKEH